MMYFGRLDSALLLSTLLTNAYVSDGCVCYVGQEPRAGSDAPFGWSVAFRDPCECSETRLGGLNLRPVVKPYEVIIGGNGRPVRDNQPDEQMSSVTSATVPPCVVYITKTDGGRVPQEGMFDGYPIYLHFSVSSPGSKVEIKFKNLDGNKLYDLYLFIEGSEVKIESSAARFQFAFNDAHHYWVECLQCDEVKLGKVGNSTAILTHKDLDCDTSEVGYITLDSSDETNWAFYGEGCP